MFKHQYDFDIKIPKAVITKEKHDKIFESNLENKIIIGLCGYGKSGKDFIANKFIDGYDFHRVAFADNIKREMNEHLKETVYNHVMNGFEPVHWGKEGVNGSEDIDFFTENLEIKKIIRPYIIWYGEKIREINGPYYWINKAFEIDAKGYDKIILSDVRRIKELEIFENSNSFAERTRLSFLAAAASDKAPHIKIKSYSTLLFHVNQLGITDKDVLTHECIRMAMEKWLFDGTFYVDPRIPEKGTHRNTAMNYQINQVVKQYGIQKPDKTISPRQVKMFD